jgi:hypothetical protein
MRAVGFAGRIQKACATSQHASRQANVRWVHTSIVNVRVSCAQASASGYIPTANPVSPDEPQKSTNEQGQPPAANACASSRLNTSTSRVAVCEPPLGSVAAYSTRSSPSNGHRYALTRDDTVIGQSPRIRMGGCDASHARHAWHTLGFVATVRRRPFRRVCRRASEDGTMRMDA